MYILLYIKIDSQQGPTLYHREFCSILCNELSGKRNWKRIDTCISSVQFNHSVLSDSLPPRELQHARPPCPSPTPGVHPNSCPLRRWCHPAISSSVIPFSSCPQSLPASGSFPLSQLISSGGQSIGISASTSVLPNTQDWSPLGWTGWISLQSKSCPQKKFHELHLSHSESYPPNTFFLEFSISSDQYDTLKNKIRAK